MDPQAARCFGLTLWLWGAWLAYWLVAALGAKKTRRWEGFGSFLLQRLLLLPAYALLFGFGGDALPPSLALRAAPLAEARWLPSAPWLPWLGFALCVLGLVYSVWARFCLGSNWSGVVAVKRGHRLVREGPYAFSRHPIYTGILTASLGLAVERGVWGSLLGLGLAFVSLRLKLAVEERFMAEEFGRDYEDYAAGVKRLIPFVY